MKFTLQYNVGEHGWADASVSCEGNTYNIDSISYLGDSFLELSEAVKSLLNGASEASCFFEHEPGQTRFRLFREGEDITLQIYQFENELAEDPWEKGEKVFECITQLKRLKSQYLNEADKIIKNIGIEKYKERWGYEFPKEVYECIKNS